MDDFEKLAIIGKGAFGTVVLCRSTQYKKKVVLKEIPLHHLDNLLELKDAQNEANLLTVLHYPHIIGYYSSFINNNTLILVMEYATHGTLMDFIKHQNGKLLPLQDVLNFITQLLLAVDHIHTKNILHRDIKPHNILLTGKNGRLVKLGDFGISKVLENSLNKATSVVGTLSYMAPELCHGQPYGKHSDIWSLGCVFYSILTLKIAFDAPSLAGVLNKIMYGIIEHPIDISVYDATLAELVSEMLNREPNLRPSIPMIMCNHLIMPYMYQLLVDFGITFNTS